MNKKLIFIVSCPRSGSTLLLSYLCSIPNTKVLYETKIFSSMYRGENDCLVNVGLDCIAKYFDSFEEEIVIEKTPEHVFHLEDIETLRSKCKRDIHIIYVVRPPIPTVLSLLECARKNTEIWGKMDLLGACEKYEESLIFIYHNLILKSHKDYIYKEKKNVPENLTHIDGNYLYITTPYSLCVSYRELIQNPYTVISGLLDDLYIKVDIQYLINNRITNIRKIVPLVESEEHHSNIFKSTKEVEEERLTKIVARVDKGVKDRFINDFNYIRNYFEHPITKETIYDLVVNKKVLKIENNPLVTIIIPLYNKEKYIIDTLNSILNQSYKNIRVVVIDDASTDNSLGKVEQYYNSLPYHIQAKLWIIRKIQNQGVSYTRNLGLSGNADIYSFCDADDIWDRTLIEKSVETFKKYPYIDCVYSRILKKVGDKVIEDKSKICNGNVFNNAIQFNFLGCGSNLFIKSQLIEDNEELRFDESYSGCEDWDFLIQLSKIASFKCTKEYLVTYRQVENSLSSNSKNQFDQGRNILKRYSETEDKYKILLTRLFFFYLSHRNFTWENTKELDFRFILEILLDKCKSYVKHYISKIS